MNGERAGPGLLPGLHDDQKQAHHDGEERNAARAKYLRTRLREHGGSNAN